MPEWASDVKRRNVRYDLLGGKQHSQELGFHLLLEARVEHKTSVAGGIAGKPRYYRIELWQLHSPHRLVRHAGPDGGLWVICSF